MADDITLTVRVRDMTRGDFNRLDNQLDRMRRSLQGVNRSTASAGQHSARLGRDINALSQRFRQLQQTGNLTSRQLRSMRGMLDAMSRSALQAARSGEITGDKFRDLNAEIGSLRAQFNYLDRDVNNNTNTLRRNNNQVTRTVRLVNGVVRSVNTNTRTIDGNTRVISSWTRELGRADNSLRQVTRGSNMAGGAFKNLHSKLIGLGVVLVATLLPTIGALSPMLFGTAAVFGAAALAADDLKEAAKQLEPQFRKWQKTASEAIKPGIEKSLGNLKSAMSQLNPVIKVGGEAFATFLEKTSRAMANPFFQEALLKNVQMGSKWFLEFAGSMGTFTRAFLDFGTKSQPALDAWQNLLGGFLDRGLPNMFKEMEQGIKGSSEFLNGLANLINDHLLPGLGRMAGSFMEAFGPLLRELLEAAGQSFTFFSEAFERGMEGLEPFAKIAADALNGLTQIIEIAVKAAGALAESLGGALVDAFLAFAGVDTSDIDNMTGGFTKISDWVSENEGKIRGAFFNIASAITDMVTTGVSMLPTLWAGFRLAAEGVITTADLIVSTLANTFGKLAELEKIPGIEKIPGAELAIGIGKTFQNMNTEFDKFAEDFRTNLDSVGGGIVRFTEEAVPRLNRSKLTLNVTEAKQNLQSIKEQLADPSLTAERRAQLTADKTEAEAALAAARSELEAFDRYQADATMGADPSKFFGEANRVEGWRPPKKTANIDGNTSPFWSAVRGAIGRVLGTSYINVVQRFVAGAHDNRMASRFGASGGKASMLPKKKFANGGSVSGQVLEGPGTKTSDSLVARLSAGEFVMRAAAVDKYGAQFMHMINQGRLPKFASGGDVKSARNQIKADTTISHFGRMAGWRDAEFASQVAKSDSVKDVVTGLTDMRALIQKAGSGRAERNALRILDHGGQNLLHHQKKLIQVNKSLDQAKDKLQELRDAASRLKDSVKNGILSESNITKAANAEESRVTINTLMSQMTASAANSGQFAKMLADLKKRGLSGSLIEQIAQAGIEGGGMETAAAILGGGASEIKKLNDLQTKINWNANSLGNTAADAMYGAGIKAADGLVKGLQAKQDQIESHMLKLAKSMESAIKKALGIKSPSRVLMKIGHETAEGFALGIEKNQRPKHSWESMLNVGRSAGYGPVSGSSGSSGQPLIVHLSLAGKDVGEILIDPIRRSVRHRGGNVQAVLGK